jgi:hypothetical protein
VNEFDDLDQLEREFGPSLRLALRHIAAEITDDRPTSSFGPNGDGPDYLDQLSRRSTTVTMIDTEPSSTGPVTRHRWPILAVAAAFVAIVVGGVVFVIRDDSSDPEIPAATTVDPGAMTAAEIAQGFVEAYGAFDVERAITYLADDADITGLIDGFTTDEVQGTVDELRLLTSLLDAQSHRQTLDSCVESSSSATDTSIHCTFEWQSLRSDELGFAPFDDGYFDLTVRDGAIVRASLGPPSVPFFVQVWTPFAEWINANHPEHAAVMYNSPDADGVRLTEEAFPFWEQDTQEYVQVVLTRRAAYAAEVGAICATQATQLGELAAPAEGALDQLAAWNTAVAAILNQAHSDLTALDVPPATDTTAYTTFHPRLARLVGIAQESAEAALGGDSTRLAELDTEYLEARQVISDGPAGSGLEVCLESLPR